MAFHRRSRRTRKQKIKGFNSRSKAISSRNSSKRRGNKVSRVKKVMNRRRWYFILYTRTSRFRRRY